MVAASFYAPDRERIATTNAWAFLHWLRLVQGVDLPDWAALQRFSAQDPARFASVIARFARLPAQPVRLAGACGPQQALVLRPANGPRLCLSGDALQQIAPPHAEADDWDLDVLARLWPTAQLIRPLAEVLLHADLRPDDRVVVIGPAWPWLAALRENCVIVLAIATDILAVAAEERASVLVAPATTLAGAAFRRAGRRPDLSHLRTIIATGGPLSPEGRRRIYTWVKSDVLLLARTGDTFWGNPLEPVMARPAATPAFMRRASVPAPQ